MKGFVPMTRIATFLRPAPVAATALAAATGAWLAWTPIAGADTQPGTVADLVARTSPSVVTVLSTQETGPGMQGLPFGPGSPFEEFFRHFGLPEGATPFPMPEQPQGRQAVGLGSGFVIEQDGYIVTNNHVVEDAASVKIRLADEREFDAEVIGTDPQTDLALVKIDADGLPVLPLGDSDAVRVGEDVIAVGNPFGLGGTVTRGIVSAMARDINAGPYVDFIQTDAAINRGNSGGPLLNLQGEVIGVNSAIYSPNGGSVGVGFAVPSTTVKAVVAQLRSSGAVERGWLGVQIQNVSPDIATALGLDAPRGALVADVVETGPSVGKLEVGDVILAFNGEPVDSSRELPKLVAAAAPDASVKIDILRDGREQTIDFTLGRFETEQVVATSTGRDGSASSRLGATLAPITPEARAQLQLDEDVRGVVITSLDGSGVAAEADLQVGDVILQVGNTPVETPADVDRVLKATSTDAVLLQIERGGNRLFVGVRLS
jgi:serine protease Do